MFASTSKLLIVEQLWSIDFMNGTCGIGKMGKCLLFNSHYCIVSIPAISNKSRVQQNDLLANGLSSRPVAVGSLVSM